MTKAILPSLWFTNDHLEVVSKVSAGLMMQVDLKKPLDLPELPLAAQHPIVLKQASFAIAAARTDPL